MINIKDYLIFKAAKLYTESYSISDYFSLPCPSHPPLQFDLCFTEADPRSYIK